MVRTRPDGAGKCLSASACDGRARIAVASASKPFCIARQKLEPFRDPEGDQHCWADRQRKDEVTPVLAQYHHHHEVVCVKCSLFVMTVPFPGAASCTSSSSRSCWAANPMSRFPKFLS
jgi:hypothetical protein